MFKAFSLRNQLAIPNYPTGPFLFFQHFLHMLSFCKLISQVLTLFISGYNQVTAPDNSNSCYTL